MTGFVRLGDMSAGHDNYPPTALVWTPITRTYFNGKLLGVHTAEFSSHSNDRGGTHPQPIRKIVSRSLKTSFEGFKVGTLGDPISDGDKCAQCSEDSFGL